MSLLKIQTIYYGLLLQKKKEKKLVTEYLTLVSLLMQYIGADSQHITRVKCRAVF